MRGGSSATARKHTGKTKHAAKSDGSGGDEEGGPRRITIACLRCRQSEENAMARARKQAKAAGLPVPPGTTRSSWDHSAAMTNLHPRAHATTNTSTYVLNAYAAPPVGRQDSVSRDANFSHSVAKLRLSDMPLPNLNSWSRAATSSGTAPAGYTSLVPPSPHSPVISGSAWRHTLDPTPQYFDPYSYGTTDTQTLEPLSYSTSTSPSTSAHASPALEPHSDEYVSWSHGPISEGMLAPMPRSEPPYGSSIAASQPSQRPRLLHSISLPAPNMHFAAVQNVSYADLLEPYERQLAMLPKHDPNPFYSPDLAYTNLARTDEPSIPTDYINPRQTLAPAYEWETPAGTVVSSVPFFEDDRWHPTHDERHEDLYSGAA
ncbi:hypothetical protein OIV83_000535 [Microbotryomycetes sp. JL201]|nr:hypothetical protein OIV83_000535 [Microbotryomycetes sp. JL201]